MARIVIADDHALVRAGMRRILEATGHIVVGEVGDGLGVVSTVRDLRPDVLVLDLGLPGLHGLDVIEDVLKNVSDVRVMVVSAFDRGDFVLSALRKGAAGYVLKSAGTAELLQALELVAQGRYYVSPQASATLARAVSSEGRVKGDPYDQLTPRERQVFHLMAEGLTNGEIGKRLFVAPRTAETHRMSIMRKLLLNSQTEVVIYALRKGLLGLEHASGPPPHE